MKRKICIITGSRSEYGLLRWVISGVDKSPVLHLQLIATGMHLSPEFGNTYQEIEQDGFEIDYKIETLLSSDSGVGVAKSVGLGVIGFSDAFAELKPDLILILGDRYEILPVAISALYQQIPIAHLHGGEVTSGSVDDAVRHAITKMSQFHFVATESYRKRVIQLGESPDRVHVVGGLGLDNISKLEFIDRLYFQQNLKIEFKKKNFLVTFHPVSYGDITSSQQLDELLRALEALNDASIFITLPNADSDGRLLAKMINDFACLRKNVYVFESLGYLKYLSLMRFVDGVIGNSSSGIIEAPEFRVGSINIGERQNGREKASSIIDCKPVAEDILDAVSRLFSTEFQKKLANVENPYNKGGASASILKKLESKDLNLTVAKDFFDINFGTKIE